MPTQKDLELAEELVWFSEFDGADLHPIEDGYVRGKLVESVADMRADLRKKEAEWLRKFAKLPADEKYVALKARVAELEAP